MRIYDFGKTCYYEAKEFFDRDYDPGFMEKHVNAVIRRFTKRKLFREVLEAYSNAHGLEGYILLHAHGSGKGKTWIFADGKRRNNMQRWIDKRDGQALAILLKSCNPGRYEVHSEKSIIIHSKHNFNFRDLIRGGHLRIYVPREC